MELVEAVNNCFGLVGYCEEGGGGVTNEGVHESGEEIRETST